MKTFGSIIQIVISVLLSVLILLQAKGTGLGKTFGGTGSNFSTKRGMEKTVYLLTIVLAALFALSSLIQTVIFSQ